MTRTEVATAVGTRLKTQLADAGMTAADTTENLKEPIDDALRAMGYAEGDLAAAQPTDAPGFLAMVRYHALRAVWERIGDRMRISVGGDSFSREQTFANVEKLLALARADAEAIWGPVVAGGEADPFVALDLAYLERTDDEFAAAYGD